MFLVSVTIYIDSPSYFIAGLVDETGLWFPGAHFLEPVCLEVHDIVAGCRCYLRGYCLLYQIVKLLSLVKNTCCVF